MQASQQASNMAQHPYTGSVNIVSLESPGRVVLSRSGFSYYQEEVVLGSNWLHPHCVSRTSYITLAKPRTGMTLLVLRGKPQKIP